MATASPIHAPMIHVVKIDAKGRTTPDVFKISKARNEMVKWEAADPDQYFTVEFKDKSPFYESQFSLDAPFSGLVRREVLADPQREYKYTVRIGGHEVDPTGIIDP